MSHKLIITVMAATLVIGGCKKKDGGGEVPIEPSVSETKSAPKSTSMSDSTPAATPQSGTVDYTASGNEPFWTITISGDTATYTTPENKGGVTFNVSKTMVGSAPQFRGKMDGKDIVLVLTGVECENDMSGDKLPMTATLLTPSATYGGCAK